MYVVVQGDRLPVCVDRVADASAPHGALGATECTSCRRRDRLARASFGQAALDPGALARAVASAPCRVDREHRRIVQLWHRISIGQRASERLREVESGHVVTGEVEHLRAEGDVAKTFRLAAGALGYPGDD